MCKKIVIIDDVPLNIRLLQEIFEDDGYQVYGICNNISRELVFDLASIMPDIVFLDVMMPGISGYELCSCIKENSATKHIPVIMLTAMTEKESVDRAFAAGAQGFLSKPFDEEDVLAILRAATKKTHGQINALPAPSVHFKQHSKEAFSAKAVFEKLHKNIALYQATVSSFEKNTSQLLLELTLGIDRKDGAAIIQKSHALKGLLMFLGAKESVRLLLDIEKDAKGAAFHQMERLYHTLRNEIYHVTSLLNELLIELAPVETSCRRNES